MDPHHCPLDLFAVFHTQEPLYPEPFAEDAAPLPELGAPLPVPCEFEFTATLAGDAPVATITDFTSMSGFESDLRSPEDFHTSGHSSFDTQNNCIVIGDVRNDIRYVDQQTTGTCSLMCQEQFYQRYHGVGLSESELMAFAESQGVFTPEGGTNFAGQDLILDFGNIPHQRLSACDLITLDSCLTGGNDAIIGVDAREYYQDPSIPPGAGHAVAIVGKGLDPSTQETKGFYITDSNLPGTCRFISSDALQACWTNDAIIIPPPSAHA